MIMGMCLILISLGILCTSIDVFMPIPGLINLTVKLCGLGMGFIGILILAGRNSQTGAGYWLDLPSQDTTICIHSDITGKRLDPNAKFYKTKNIGLGILKGKKKVFKDTGGGFRIAGHDVRRTHEKICADIPEWLGQYLYQVKNKYLIRNDTELFSLFNSLRNLHKPVPGMTVEEQLRSIKILEPVMKDDDKKQVLLNMGFDDLRNMTEHVFDGESIHMEDVENFIKLAKPNELDTWITQEINKNTLEKRNYRDPGTAIDWGKWLPALGFFMIIAVLATVILLSYIGK